LEEAMNEQEQAERWERLGALAVERLEQVLASDEDWARLVRGAEMKGRGERWRRS
jgi:hypothetical protein